MAATLWNPYPTPVFNQNGLIASGAKASFFFADTSTPLSVFTDATLSTPHTHPVVANGNGVFDPIFLPYVDYRFRVTDASGVLIFEANSVANPPPSSGGGGGGGGVEQQYLFQTGFTVWQPLAVPITGYIRLNGRTIGSAISSATERANDDCEELYNLLWNNLSNTICPVIGGRGVTAAADWAANKAITPPDMRGRTPVGLDDMGGSAANIVQVSATGNVTNGSANITSTTNITSIARGMRCIIDGAFVGNVASISGTTVTLSANYTGTNTTGKALRFSYFLDAQTVGATGGLQTAAMTAEELAAHTHVSTYEYDYGMWVIGSGDGFNVGSGAGNLLGKLASQLEADNTLTSGEGRPSNIIQPSRLGTWFMKL
jgi:hypothetical protein